MSKIITFIIAFFISVLIIRGIEHQKATEKLAIGKKYLYSTDFINQDPFYVAQIDTCLVLNIKNDYTQYQVFTKNGNFKISTKTEFLAKYIKEIK